MSVPGYDERTVCPFCRTYTQQRIIARGERECCNCGNTFALKGQERKIKKPAKILQNNP